jgi:hypothetical protein
VYRDIKEGIFLTEVWKDIDGYNGRYRVSNLGRIWSFAQDTVRGKIKTGNPTMKGYLSICLRNPGCPSRTIPIHRLVAKAFIPNPDNLPQVNHKDEVKTNNSVDNLEWCTNEYNARYGTKQQRAAEANRCCETTSKKVYSVDEAGHTEYYASICEAERQTGNHHSNIVRALKGRIHTCGGRHCFYC